jgi:hypothetical protein
MNNDIIDKWNASVPEQPDRDEPVDDMRDALRDLVNKVDEFTSNDNLWNLSAMLLSIERAKRVLGD